VSASRSAAAATAAAALLILLAFLLAPKAIRKMPDFEVYWTAAARARAAEPLYRAGDGHYQFKYLPAFAILAMPAARLPLETAKAVWFGASVALLASFVALAIAALPDRRRRRWVLVAVLLVAMGKFYAHELVLGQVNVLFGVIVLLAVHAIAAGREAAAGLLFALAVVIKPYAVLFAPWLAGRRRAGSIGAFAAGLGTVLLLPAFVYGAGAADLHGAWWRTVTESTAPNLTNADNVSIAGMYSKWLGASALVRPVIVLTSVALLAVAAFVFARRGRVASPEPLEVALLLTLIPLLSPQGWDYVFLVATPAIVVLTNYAERLPPVLRRAAAAAIAVAGLTLYDVVGRANYAAFMALSVVTVCFLIVVVALATLRVRAAA
jgi:hypothetical protein